MQFQVRRIWIESVLAIWKFKSLGVQSLAFGILVTSILFAFATQSHAFRQSDLVEGFKKTAFGSEFSRLGFSSRYVRKFNGTVRFYVRSEVGVDHKRRVERFIRSLNRVSPNLSTKIVTKASSANFTVHVVRRRNFEDVVRKHILRRANAPVFGKCLVRSIYSRSGISRSDAVIVADEGDKLFRRCMIEELVQGLGLLNDDASLRYSMFNDTSRFTSFQRFDKALLIMLYDPRVKNGASMSSINPLLPSIANSAIKRVR